MRRLQAGGNSKRPHTYQSNKYSEVDEGRACTDSPGTTPFTAGEKPELVGTTPYTAGGKLELAGTTPFTAGGKSELAGTTTFTAGGKPELAGTTPFTAGGKEPRGTLVTPFSVRTRGNCWTKQVLLSAR